jgi:hypothetical protein
MTFLSENAYMTLEAETANYQRRPLLDNRLETRSRFQKYLAHI